jgi:hypothetical protein
MHAEKLKLGPVCVSRRQAAHLLSVSTDHVDVLLRKRTLERVQIGERKIAITTRSIDKLVHGEAA